VSSPESRPSSDLPRIVGGSPTDDEIAAIVAVFGELITEASISHDELQKAPAPSTWVRTRRSMRGQPPARGVWGDLP
jgi:Acyl-CoA carboxylase epsilon subunit